MRNITISPGVNVGCRLRVPKLPVVFLHGVAGFSRIFGARYARSWQRVARRHGISLLTPTAHAAAKIDVRANHIAQFLDVHLPHGKFHLIGHSMGGLDARYLVSHLGLAERAVTVATLGTPHRGVVFAAELARWMPRLGEWHDFKSAFADLTEPAMAAFNTDHPDCPQVQYFSWTGRARWWQINPIFWCCARWLEPYGPHDGLVSEASARWGTFLGHVMLNHYGLMGWQFFPLDFAYLWADRLCAWVYDVLAEAEQ